jgi:hypothetical protein
MTFTGVPASRLKNAARSQRPRTVLSTPRSTAWQASGTTGASSRTPETRMIRLLPYLAGGAFSGRESRLLRAGADRPTMTALAMRLATVR